MTSLSIEEVVPLEDLSKIKKLPVRECRDLSAYEKETIILFNKEQKEAEISTWARDQILYLRKLSCFKPTKGWVTKDGKFLVGLEGKVPKEAISVGRRQMNVELF